MNLRVSEEVRDLLRSLAPEPRRRLSLRLDAVEAGKALEPLEASLSGFYKVRSGRYRVVCAVRGDTVFALFADEREMVYEVASVALLESILERMQDD